MRAIGSASKSNPRMDLKNENKVLTVLFICGYTANELKDVEGIMPFPGMFQRAGGW